MITPRRTRLVRVADLQTFRRVVASLALDAGVPPADRLVVVPSRSAARELARLHAGAPWPDLVTREQLYERLQARLDPVPVRLTPFDREAAIRAASAQAAGNGAAPPFVLRPGLIAEIVRFYDQLRRQRQSVDRFEALLLDSLSGNPDDRGAERMVRQTRFLAATYRAYEARLSSLDAFDEHRLREHLIASAPHDPIRHILVSVGDWIGDVDGLFPADFDLLTRLPGLQAIDLVATSGLLASGFHQRVHEWLPGLEEVDAAAAGVLAPSSCPVLIVPEGTEPALAFVRRDREEELTAVARCVTAEPTRVLPAGVVFNRPLPYLYAAGDVFESAGLKFETHDALPLAAEPYAAAVDLVVQFVLSAFARADAVALLRSPHFEWSREGCQVTREAITALDRLLIESRYLGELERLRGLAGMFSADAPGDLAETARPAFEAMCEAATELAPLVDPAPLSGQVGRLAAFLASHARPLGDRHARARAAIAGLLASLGAAYAAHGDPEATVETIAPELRRWIEDETFVPECEEAALRLLDAQAARYADVRQLFVVGLVEGEWPDRPSRNIFYPPGLLATLGWPSEADRRGAGLAAFVDLLRSPLESVRLSTFLLDDEALVEASTLVDEAGNAGLNLQADRGAPTGRVFDDEMLSLDPPQPDTLPAGVREWVDLRTRRTAGADARYHGEAGGGARPAVVSVSAVETYLTCPFKYFARHVLRLEDEPDDDEVMDPKRQGQFVHRVFEQFFREWDGDERGAITPETLADAHALFERVAEACLDGLSEEEAALERTRLLGSPVAPGLADAVFRMEAERPVPVVRRELEFKLKGLFTFDGPGGPRRLEIRGVADRVDVLADGTFRLIDYKLGRAPNKTRALQLPIYALCAEQKLQERLGEAAYIAFREPKRIVPLFTARSDRDQVLRSAAERLVTAVDAIEAGHFPPTPEDVFLCSFCGYTAVCRKDYVE